MTFTVHSPIGTPSSTGTGGGQISVTPPTGTLTGKLLLLFSASSSSTATIDVTPSGYVRLDTNEAGGGNTFLAVHAKIGTSSESAVNVSYTAGGCVGWIVAIESSTGWPAITVAGDIVAGESKSNPVNGGDVYYNAHTVVGDGNCGIQFGGKVGNTTGLTGLTVSTTSGYTTLGEGDRENVAAGIFAAAQMLTDPTAIGVDLAQNNQAITNWATSLARDAITLELTPAAGGSNGAAAYYYSQL